MDKNVEKIERIKQISGVRKYRIYSDLFLAHLQVRIIRERLNEEDCRYLKKIIKKLFCRCECGFIIEISIRLKKRLWYVTNCS